MCLRPVRTALVLAKNSLKAFEELAIRNVTAIWSGTLISGNIRRDGSELLLVLHDPNPTGPSATAGA